MIFRFRFFKFFLVDLKIFLINETYIFFIKRFYKLVTSYLNLCEIRLIHDLTIVSRKTLFEVRCFIILNLINAGKTFEVLSHQLVIWSQFRSWFHVCFLKDICFQMCMPVSFRTNELTQMFEDISVFASWWPTVQRRRHLHTTKELLCTEQSRDGLNNDDGTTLYSVSLKTSLVVKRYTVVRWTTSCIWWSISSCKFLVINTPCTMTGCRPLFLPLGIYCCSKHTDPVTMIKLSRFFMSPVPLCPSHFYGSIEDTQSEKRRRIHGDATEEFSKLDRDRKRGAKSKNRCKKEI